MDCVEFETWQVYWTRLPFGSKNVIEASLQIIFEETEWRFQVRPSLLDDAPTSIWEKTSIGGSRSFSDKINTLLQDIGRAYQVVEFDDLYIAVLLCSEIHSVDKEKFWRTAKTLACPYIDGHRTLYDQEAQAVRECCLCAGSKIWVSKVIALLRSSIL